MMLLTNFSKRPSEILSLLLFLNIFLRPIYMVQLCRMRYGYDKSMTSPRHESFRVNETYNLLTIVVYDTKNVVGF